MTLLIVGMHVFVCLFLIVVILLQAGRGQGLSWGTYGGSPQSLLGTKTTSFLTRLTTVCAMIFLLTCVALNMIETHKARSLLGPAKPFQQVDFERIKKALDEAEVADVRQDVKPALDETGEAGESLPSASEVSEPLDEAPSAESP